MRGLCPLSNGECAEDGDEDERAERAPREEAAPAPLALGDAKLAHERRALERALRSEPLRRLAKGVEQGEGAEEPEEREHCAARSAAVGAN
jgi:hypothetical protein